MAFCNKYNDLKIIKNKLDSLLMLIQFPFTVLHCEDVLCTTHDIVIESLYDSII